MEGKKSIIVHVDMDAFFASIEQLDHAEYRDKPLVVGADPLGGKGRGVVSAASYEARRFGIHSAMPISRAYRLCPGAIFVRPRFERYIEVSRHIMNILESFSPKVEQVSIDEAFLDCTGTEAFFGTEAQIGRQIKERIRKETALTASVGIASNKSVAKIASELSKPDGLTVCPEGEERKFLTDLPLHYLWGAGKKTVNMLNALGYKKIGDVASSSPHVLVNKMGKYGMSLWYLANGIDERTVEPSSIRKSISEELTFSEDISDDAYVEHVIFEIADNLTREMRKLGIKGRTITIKIRLADFKTFTRSNSLKKAVDDMKTVRASALDQFRAFDRHNKKIRLIGIVVSNFELQEGHIPEQLELFHKSLEPKKGIEKSKRSDPEKILDMMKTRFGKNITRAAFIHPDDGKE